MEPSWEDLGQLGGLVGGIPALGGPGSGGPPSDDILHIKRPKKHARGQPPGGRQGPPPFCEGGEGPGEEDTHNVVNRYQFCRGATLGRRI